MTPTFDEWLRDNVEDVKIAKARGMIVHEVEVHFAAYIDWLGKNNLPDSGVTKCIRP